MNKKWLISSFIALSILIILTIFSFFFFRNISIPFLSKRLKPNIQRKNISEDKIDFLTQETHAFWFKDNKRVYGPIKKYIVRQHSAKNMTPEQVRKLKELESLGYLSGYKKAPNNAGVLEYDKKHAYNGFNLCISGHAPEALLIDMKGDIFHKWSFDFGNIPGKIKDPSIFAHNFFRRAYLYDNGDLLAIYEKHILVKLDKFSNLIWYYDKGAHHDLFVTEEGTIYVLGSEASLIPSINKENPILEDFICILDEQGHELRKVSILECFLNSPYEQAIRPLLEKGGDVFHTNTIQPLDGAFEYMHPAFKKGNVLISIPKFQMIAIVDLNKKTIAWGIRGGFGFQHDPTFLKNGNMIIFDNFAHGNEKYSRVFEFDPISRDLIWEWKADPPESFFSMWCGAIQILPNRNLLIVDTTGGKAYEITPDKKIAWLFSSPYRVGKNRELVAALLDIVRVDYSYVGWLNLD